MNPRRKTAKILLISLFVCMAGINAAPAQANTFTKLLKGFFGSKNAEKMAKPAPPAVVPQAAKQAAEASKLVSPSAAASSAAPAAGAALQDNSMVILESVENVPNKNDQYFLTPKEMWKKSVKEFYSTDVLPKTPKTKRTGEDRILKNTQQDLPAPNRMKNAQIEENFQNMSAVESAINRQIFQQDAMAENQVNPDIQDLFSFRTGMEALESLMPSYKEILSMRCSPNERALLLNTFKNLDKEFFYYNPSKQTSYMVPRTEHLYSTMFYKQFAQDNPTLNIRNITDILERTGTDKVLTVIDTKLWMTSHNGQLPRFLANKTLKEQQVAINFYNLLDEAKSNTLPVHLRPLKQVVLSIGKPIQGSIPLTAWTNFTGKWLATFSDEELVKIFLNYNKPPQKAFFDGMAADIRKGLSGKLSSDKTGQTLYLLGTANATPQQTLSMLKWWAAQKNAALPRAAGNPRTLTENTDYAQVLARYREGVLFDNTLRTLDAKGPAARQAHEILLPLAQNYLRQTAQRLDEAKQLLDKGEIKQADVKALHTDIQNPLLKALAPRETAQLNVRIQTFNKLYKKYNDVSKFLTYCRMHPNEYFYEEGHLIVERLIPSLRERWGMDASVAELQQEISELRASGLVSADLLELQLQRLVKKGQGKN